MTNPYHPGGEPEEPPSGGQPNPYPEYQPYTPPPQPYGVPPGYGGFQPEHPQSVTVLVLGIVSLVLLVSCCAGFLTGIPAWVIGHKALKQQAQYRVGLVRAGHAMGIAATVVSLLGIPLFVALGLAGGLD